MIEFAVVKRSTGKASFGPYPALFQAQIALRYDTKHPNRYYIATRELVPTEWTEVEVV